MRGFFYGTLMDRDVLRKVLGRSMMGLASTPATLAGYRRLIRRGRKYPILVRAKANDRIEGIVVGPLTGSDLDRLDWFEGSDYKRVELTVDAAGSGPLQAWTYVAKPGVPDGGREWSFEHWRRRDKPAFFRRHAGRGGRATETRRPR